MNLELELSMIGKLLLSAFLAGIIGYEREKLKKPAGLRTHILVALGSTLFTLLSYTSFPQDPARIASYVVMGIGFIGAGTVLQVKEKITGLTTAASLWVIAAVGMCVALEYYVVSVVITVLCYLILKLAVIEKKSSK